MTVSADALYLPMLSPARLPSGQPIRAWHPAKGQSDGGQHHRIYRMPSREGQDGIVYGPGGRLSADSDSGHLIDLYA